MSCLSDKRKSVLRERLLTYIHSHSQGNKVPSERQLADALDMNAYLVRKHLAAFEKEGILLRRPRSGTFLTDFPVSTPVPVYGLVCGRGDTFSYLDNPMCVTGVIQAFYEHECLLKTFSFKTENQLLERVREHGLKGLVWVTPPLDVIASRLPYLVKERGLPLVLAAPYVTQNLLKTLPYNVITNDFDWNYHIQAMFFASRHCRHVLYFSPHTDWHGRLHEELAASGIACHDVFELEDLVPTLDALRQGLTIDGIICSGVRGYNETLLEYLLQSPQFRPVLRLENLNKVHRLLEAYPQQQVDFQCEPYETWAATLGRQAAEMAMKASQDTPMQPNNFIRQNVIDDRTLSMLSILPKPRSS